MSLTPLPGRPIRCLVLIPNHNGMAWLPDCLGSLRTESPAGVEALVIDDASTDESVRYLEQEFPQAGILSLPANLGFLRAVNLGLLVARRRNAESVLLLNNDTRLGKGSIEALLAQARSRPEFGVLSPIQTDFQGALSPRTRAILSSPDRDNLEEMVEADWVEGSCLWIRRAALEQVGYLDPLYAPCDFEEVDLCRRVRTAGWRVGVVATSAIQHHGAGSFAGAAMDRRRIVSERNYLLYRASEGADDLARCWRTFVFHAGRRLAKAIWHGDPSPTTVLAAVASTPRLMPALWSKVLRDGAGQPCPILGSGLSPSPTARLYADCVRRLEQENFSIQEAAA
jgi:GT2 family glycosyltransferase